VRRTAHSAGWMVFVVSLLAACGSDSGRPASVEPEVTPPTTSTTSAPESTAVAETTAATVAATTSTTAPSKVGFDPACTDVEPTRDLASSDEAALDVFGPIGTVPSVEVELPQGHSQKTGELMTTSAASTRIPGGVLLNIGSNSSGYFPGGMLAAIDHDGTLRWVHCFDQGIRSVVVAPPDSSPTEALIGTYVPVANALGSIEWNLISLVDGTVTRSLDDVIAASGIDGPSTDVIPIATGAGTVVLGPDPDHVVDAKSDRLLRLDLGAMTATEVPYPPEFDGHPSRDLRLDIGVGGQPLQMTIAPDSGLQLPASVEVDGAWVTKPGSLRKAWPVTAGYSFLPNADGAFPALEAYDATGRVRWKRDDVAMRIGEGFSAGVDGDVVVAVSCVTVDVDVQPCENFRTGGYSMVDGHTLWQLDGFRLVTALGDGHAMISVPSESESVQGWMLIDTDTGELIANDQQWDDPAAFNSECCGGDEYVRVTRLDGVLAVFSNQFVRIWHPQAVAHPTVEITL
jgi:hypothetical protein